MRYALLWSALFVAVLAIVGCSQSIQPDLTQIRKPRAAWMEPSPPLPEVVEHTDAYQSDANCSAQYVKETGKLRALQGYARTVTAQSKKQ